MYELSRHLRHFNRCIGQLGSPKTLLNNLSENSSYLSKRTTFILKRRYPTRLPRVGGTGLKLKGKDYVYDLVQDTEVVKKPAVPVVLKQYVEGVGMEGEVVRMSRNKAYNDFLLPGLADYVTPEVAEAAKHVVHQKKEESMSSPFAPLTVKYLENLVLNVVMNKETPWTIQPWHIRVSLRKAGVHVPDRAIKIPDKPISGPDLSLEGKDFVIVITVNGKEKANVRCRLHHWSTEPSNRLPYVKYPASLKSTAIFSDQEEILEDLPLVPEPKVASIFK